MITMENPKPGRIQSFGRVYISGPITGTEDYAERFDAAEKLVRARGYKTVNPRHNALAIKDGTHDQYMHVCFAQMDLCDSILMLEGWENSKGARLEREHAEQNGMFIFYENELRGGATEKK